MNEFLERLLKELLQVHDPDRRAELLARIAGIRARVGDFDGAQQTIDELRAIYGDGRSGVVTVSINLAEGLVHHYRAFRPQALDRFTRAQVLSVAMKYSPGVALSSAWKANYHFEFEEYEDMSRCLLLAVQHVTETDHDALTRLGMILFNAFTMLGDTKASQSWFLRTKDAALANKDRSSVEALLYNKAAFSVTRARVEHCLAPIGREELRTIRMDALSARNYREISRLASLPEHLVLWDARLKILEGDYASALPQLAEVRDSDRFSAHNFSKAFIDLEIAYCQAMCGDLSTARSLPLQSSDFAFENFDVDEQLVAAWMKVRLGELDHALAVQEGTQATLDKCAEQYKKMMGRLADQLTPFADGLKPDMVKS